VTTISLFSPHGNPHGTPLCQKYRLDYKRDLIYKSNRAGDVVENWHLTHLFPRHRHVFQQLDDSVWHVFQSTKIYALVMSVVENKINFSKRKLLAIVFAYLNFLLLISP